MSLYSIGMEVTLKNLIENDWELKADADLFKIYGLGNFRIRVVEMLSDEEKYIIDKIYTIDS